MDEDTFTAWANALAHVDSEDVHQDLIRNLTPSDEQWLRRLYKWYPHVGIPHAVRFASFAYPSAGS